MVELFDPPQTIFLMLMANHNKNSNYRNEPLKFKVVDLSCNSTSTTALLCSVHSICRSNLSCLQSLSLFITYVKSIQIGLDLLGLSASTLRLFFHLSLSLSHHSSLRPSQFTEHWMRSDLGSTMFLSLPGTCSPNKLGSPQCKSGVITHTHLCRWLSVDNSVDNKGFLSLRTLRECKGSVGYCNIFCTSWYSNTVFVNLTMFILVAPVT